MTPAPVDLWLLAADEHQPDSGLLDAAERERAARFVQERDRRLYTLAHAALRLVLAERTGVPPQELRFTRETCPCCGGPHGRPRLEGPAGAPEFSLSHGGELVLLGLAPAGVPIGVDVEHLPAAEALPDLVPALHPAEQAELTAVPAIDRPAAFARLWTRKEAYLKGLGTGLGRSPAADYLGEATDPQTLPPGWTLGPVPTEAVPTATPHAAAYAVRAGNATVRIHHTLGRQGLPRARGRSAPRPSLRRQRGWPPAWPRSLRTG